MNPPFLPLYSFLATTRTAVLKKLIIIAALQKSIFVFAALLFSFSSTKAYAQANSFPYNQSFEEAFTTGTAVQFLSHWWGNEVSSNSRIYQASPGYSGSLALGAAPTSTFTPDIRLLLDTQDLQAATFSFWARSAQNGSGTKPALLQLSFSADGGTTFSAPVMVGNTNSFPNADTGYQLYTFSLPPELLQTTNAVIRWQVLRSEEGSGTAAKILMDDVVVAPASQQLQLLSAAVRSAQEISLTFNMPVDKAAAERVANYTISPAITITSSQLSAANPRQVVLTVNGLSAGSYSLIASNIAPAGGGEPIATTTLTFTYTNSPQYRDIVINEIFADPNPKGSLQPQPVVLPTDTEFVELINTSSTAYNLQQLRLSGGKLPDYVLEAGAYVALVPAGKKALYEQYGPVVEVQGWKSLSNSGTKLELLDSSNGRVLDSLSYSGSWYQESGKQEGGWSLEQVNPYLQCSFAGNWRAATDSKGATPAAPNSVMDTSADTKAPQLLQAVVLNQTQLSLIFDEYIAPSSLISASIALMPAVSIASVQHRGEQVLVNLSTILENATNYRVNVAGFSDCSGNTVETEAGLIFPKAAAAGDVLINEIMYDPIADGAEWVELYNTTNHYLNLQGWYLGMREGALKNTLKLSESLLLLPPQGFLVLTPNTAALLQAHPQAPAKVIHQLKGMPSLRNNGDTLVLLNPAAQVAEMAPFSDARHHPLLSSSKGVSLERISASLMALNPAAWTSSAAPSYSTPGMPNSQQYSLETANQPLRIDPEVLEPTPDGVADVTFVHYQLDQPGLSGTLLILDAMGREIQRLANNQLLGQEGIFQWNGTNSRGERVRSGYYIVVLSVFSPDGYKQQWRKTLVVSSWL